MKGIIFLLVLLFFLILGCTSENSNNLDNKENIQNSNIVNEGSNKTPLEKYFYENEITDKCYQKLFKGVYKEGMTQEEIKEELNKLTNNLEYYEAQLNKCWKYSYIEYAINSSEYSVCDEIQYAPKRAECEAGVAEAKEDPNHCNTINEEYYDATSAREQLSVRDACKLFYIDFYLKEKNDLNEDNINFLKNICDEINELGTQLACTDYVNNLESIYVN